MADNELNVIVKAKDLAVHSFKLTSNCNRYPKKYRHSLADQIQVKSLKIFDTLTEARDCPLCVHFVGCEDAVWRGPCDLYKIRI